MKTLEEIFCSLVTGGEVSPRVARGMVTKATIHNDVRLITFYVDFPELLPREEMHNAEKTYGKLLDASVCIMPHFGDQLVTLSTCAYHASEGRFYIVGRRIK